MRSNSRTNPLANSHVFISPAFVFFLVLFLFVPEAFVNQPVPKDIPTDRERETTGRMSFYYATLYHFSRAVT